MSDPWTTWASGTLAGIGAPANATNIDTLWAWSGAESGTARLRWNNPLNTTQPEGAGTVDMNSVGVKAYPSVQIGINATVTTLRNGYYPVILANLRGSVPRRQWGNACPNLGTWGTGCGWLTANYGAAPQELGGDVLSDSDLTLIHDELQFALWGVIDTSAKSRADFLFAVKNGQSVGSIVDGWKANAQTAKWSAQLATLGQPNSTAAQQQILDAIASDATADSAILSALEQLSGKIDAAFVRPSATPGP